MRMTAPVLLVGSIPGASAQAAMTTAADGLGQLLGCLPDGETGRRKAWINFLAAGAYDTNPALESLNRPLPVDTDAADEWRHPDDHWIPRGYADHWQFRVRPGHTVKFDKLGYADAALASFEIFRRLRDSGKLVADARFMWSLPLPESATRPFLTHAEDYPAVHDAYLQAIGTEIARVLEHVPADELAIQWDIAIETVAIECNDTLPGLFPWRPMAPAYERYLADLTRAAALVPPPVVMGLHLCYGDLGHRHIVEPPHLAVCVRMANGATAKVDRPIDFIHMPVPRERSDALYFAPLADLAIGAARLYLGLIHHTDGVAGSIERLRAARAFCADFGVATECGFGRRPSTTVAELMRIHREVVAFQDREAASS